LSLEQELFDQRFARIREIEALGFKAYGHRFEPTHTLPAIMAGWQEKTGEELESEKPQVRDRGPHQDHPPHGQSGFSAPAAGGRGAPDLRPEGRGERTEYALYQLLDLGDIIGVEGYLFRTRTGELSVHVEKLALPRRRICWGCRRSITGWRMSRSATGSAIWI
jgi:lysyl-tRNA synthetase, class II